MSKSKILLEKLTSLVAQGLISYKDLSNEVINIIKSQRDEIILKMKISTKEETDILKRRIENNIEMIDQKPKTGVEGYKIAFIHPKSTPGLLIEICQK